MDLELPDKVAMNAWTGSAGASGRLADTWEKWALERPPRYAQPLGGVDVDPREWTDPAVGWGLVLADDSKYAPRLLATAAGAPEPIQELHKTRAARMNGPVLRYRRTPGHTLLRRYDDKGNFEDLSINGSETGVGPKQIPRYLLISGSPKAIPWEFQYALNLSRCVGRLDLPEQGLANYVAALNSDWSTSRCRRERPVVWAPDFGARDITNLLRLAIAEPIKNKLESDPEIRAANGKLCYLAGAAATWDNLVQGLSDQTPALVITTSHGQTAPLGDRDSMARDLGIPVDANGKTLPPDDLGKRWEPDGAIWYAHACCSAGSDDENHYVGLFAAGTENARLMDELRNLGGLVAPLPTRLLGHPKPLRAFIGHVHPTMDWPIRQPRTLQLIASVIRDAICKGVFNENPKPVSLAMEPCYRQVGSWLNEALAAQRDVDRGIVSARLVSLQAKLCAYDRRAMIVLGDPTACLPPPSASTSNASPDHRPG